MGSYHDRGEIEPSEAEQLQDLAYDDCGLDFYVALGKHDVWVRRDKTFSPINKLDTKHLVNIIAGIKKGRSFYGQWLKLPKLERELQRREQ